MKKIILAIFILFLASCKKEEININQTKSFTIQSTTNGASYSIKVSLPDNYDALNHTYATLYLLDGEENFDYVTKECASISQQYAKPNVLVVSIGYGKNRSDDYTPTKANEGGGGAEQFMHFIKDELIPKIEREFASNPERDHRIFLGHSFGGLCAAYAFTNFNEVFGNYLMLSPSIWYDNEILLHYEQENRDKNKNADQLVFMGLGSMESNGRMLAPFEAFYQRLKSNYPSMKIDKNIVPQLDHMGSKNPNIRESLKFYFQSH